MDTSGTHVIFNATESISEPLDSDSSVKNSIGKGVEMNALAVDGKNSTDAETMAQDSPVKVSNDKIESDSVAMDKHATEQEVSKKTEISALEKLWIPVKENSNNFSAWTKLIQHAESCCEVADIRRVFDAFLERYPLCYGYWKKYADIERNRGSPELCLAVFERGLAAIPLSVDLWLHFISYIRSVSSAAPNKPDADSVNTPTADEKTTAASADPPGNSSSSDPAGAIREAFERATRHCGLEFRSDRLWEQYCTWEASEGDLWRVIDIYRRALAVPTLSYRTHMNNLQSLASSQRPRDLLTVDQLISARSAIVSKMRADKLTANQQNSSQEPDGQVTAAEETAASLTNNENISANDTSAVDGSAEKNSQVLPPGCDELPEEAAAFLIPNSDEETKLLRDYILDPLTTLHKETEQQVSLRWSFEEAIRRPYFHVKPLERSQLNNWRTYLDFEIEQGDCERIHTLFERCLIACACYEDCWIKYVEYLESSEPVDVDRVRRVLFRACRIHLPHRPSLILMWSSFEERQGDADTAFDIVDGVCGSLRLLELYQRRANIARRKGHLQHAQKLYQQTIDQLSCELRDDTATSNGQMQHDDDGDNLLTMVAVKYVRFAVKVLNDRALAEKILHDMLALSPQCSRLYMQLIDIGCGECAPVDVSHVVSALNSAISSPLPLHQRLLFAQRLTDFLDDFADDVHCVYRAQREYAELYRQWKLEEQENYNQQQRNDISSLHSADYNGAACGVGMSQYATKRPATDVYASDLSNGVSTMDKRARVSGAGDSHAMTATAPAAQRTGSRQQLLPTPTVAAAAGGTAGYHTAAGYMQQPAAHAGYYQQPAAGDGTAAAAGYYGGSWPGYQQHYDYSQYPAAAGAYSQYGVQQQYQYQQQ